MRDVAMSDVKDDAKRRKILQRLAEKDILEIVKTKGTEEAEAKMREIISQ
jgi:siroheme synthase (precorrin-2 oxidase/ferrochelatase)